MARLPANSRRTDATPPSVISAPVPAPVSIGFLLLNDYSMIALVNALETLRMANYISRRTLYRWSVCAVNSNTPSASNGLSIEPAADGVALSECDMVFVCGGLDVRAAVDAQVRQLLRDIAARQISLGALCTGTFALASAGLLDGYRCAIHWENLAAVREEFPKVRFSPELFIIDRDRITCSGGTAPLHLMLHLVQAQHGVALALQISEQFILDRLRSVSDTQRMPQPEIIGPGYQHLLEATEIMAANIDEPLPIAELARTIGISARQLERLFHRYHHVKPAQYYIHLRLRRARELLMHSSLPIMQITIACGFQSASHFCKAYRGLFDHPPRDERRGSAARASTARAQPAEQRVFETEMATA